MPIVTHQGIYTAKLCTDNKKYLSRLLIGKTGINADFLNWNLLLTEKITLDAFIETGKESLAQLKQARAEWNQLLKENKLKSVITNKLAEIETNYLSERLKTYDPELKKQQEAIRYKKLSLISIAIVIGLAIAFPFALPLLGTTVTFIGVLCLTIGATLICCSVIPAFVDIRLINPEWYKEYSIEKEKWQQKMTAIKEITEAEIIKAETEEQISNKTIPAIQQIKQIELNKATNPLMVAAATQKISDDDTIGKQAIIYNLSFFNTKKSSVDPEQKDNCLLIYSKLNRFIEKNTV
jgi:hypothetical protein